MLSYKLRRFFIRLNYHDKTDMSTHPQTQYLSVYAIVYCISVATRTEPLCEVHVT